MGECDECKGTNGGHYQACSQYGGVRVGESPAEYWERVSAGRIKIGVKAAPKGMKFDGGKPRFDLLEFGCPDALLGVVKVMTWAVEVKGYEPHSWQGVEDGERRYAAAQRRHDNALARGETHDPESGFPHEWHIAANALFRAQLHHNTQAVPA